MLGLVLPELHFIARNTSASTFHKISGAPLPRIYACDPQPWYAQLEQIAHRRECVVKWSMMLVEPGGLEVQ